MKDYSVKYRATPWIVVENDIITDVNEIFLKQYGYTTEELKGKAFSTVSKQTFRILYEIKEYSCMQVYLFTKKLEARYVRLQGIRLDSHKLLYIFEDKPTKFEENNSFLEKLFTDNAIGIGIYSAKDFILLKGNTTYLSYLPKPYNTKEMVVGKTLEEFIPGFKGSLGEEVWRNIARSNTSLYIKERKGLMLGREDVYWDNNLIPISEEGEVRYIVSMLEDVTDRVIRRESMEKHSLLLESENKELEAIIENISDGLVVLDKEGNVIKANKVVTRIIEKDSLQGLYRLKDFIENNEQIITDENGNKISLEEHPFAKLLEGERVEMQRLTIRSNNGCIHFNCFGTPVFDDVGIFKYAVLICHDVTKLLYRDNVIRQQEEYLSIITENMTDALYIINSDGEYEYLNKRAYDIAYQSDGFNHNVGTQIETKYYDEYGNELCRQELPSTRIMLGDIIENLVIKVVNLDKTTFLAFNGRPIFDENGVIKRGLLCIRDVTDLINSKRALIESEAQRLRIEQEKNAVLEASIKTKDEFLYLITHEFRTPMAVINSALQVIELMYKDDISNRIGKLLSTIKLNSNRQIRLVNNLLDITRINSGHIKLKRCSFDIVYVTKVIVKSVDIYAKQKQVKLNFTSNKRKKQVFLDEEKYERIMLNLLSNALKFTPRGKEISVILDTQGEDYVRISVIDEGIGIPLDKQQVIFERFGQVDTNLSRQAEGTGLGLHLVKLLVDALEGKINLESEEGEGSSFTIQLPIINPQNVADITTVEDDSNLFMSSDTRIVQATSIEFSDIYFR